jgi:hypothetical protein
MKLTVEVALLGKPDRAFREDAIEWGERGAPPPEFSLGWDERERITLEASESDTLGDVLSRAGEQFDLQLPGGEGAVIDHTSFIAFDGEAPMRLQLSVTLVDNDGRARWHVYHWKEVTFAQLLRAHEAKALAGDPRRPLLVLVPAMGNGVLAEWAPYLEAMWQVIQVFATVGGAKAFGKEILSAASGRLEQSAPVLEQHSQAWTERNGTPAEIRAWLGERPWSPEDLAPLLDCTEEEAIAVLWAFGYAERQGLWWKRADEPAELLATLSEEIELSYSLDREGVNQVIADRMGAYLETGNRPPVPGIDRDRFGDMGAVQPPDSFDLVESPPGYETGELDDLLPLAQLRMACGCGKEDCHIVAEFGVTNGALKIGLSGATDHFVIQPGIMNLIASQVEFEIERAKNPDGR